MKIWVTRPGSRQESEVFQNKSWRCTCTRIYSTLSIKTVPFQLLLSLIFFKMGSLSETQLSPRGSILSDIELDIALKNWRKSDIDFDTLAITETMDPGTFSQTCFMPPIVTSSVFNTTVESRLLPPSPSQHNYARFSNPTRSHLEAALAKFDGGNYALSFSSGMAAVAAIFQDCVAGDHVIYVQSISGDTDWLIKNKCNTFGITFDEVYSRDTKDIISHMNNRTKLILLESPSNPILEIADIQAISTEAKQLKPDIILVVDNTILSPVFQRPLELGADVVIYSLTKYFAGHSDITMGSIVCNSKKLYEAYRSCQLFFGAVPSPFDCYLMMRSLKTLPLRMRHHFRSTMKIAHFLENQPGIIKVLYPGLKSHKDHELAKKQQMGCSGLLSFYIKGGLAESVTFIKALKYFRHGGSFASDVSMILIPSISSQMKMSAQDQLDLGIDENLLRLSVGLEGVETLIRDLDQAFRKTFGTTAD